MKKLILIFLLISGLSGLVYSDTLSSLREKVRFILKDTGPSSSEYRHTDIELNYWLNDATRKVVNRMKSHNNFITLRFHITTDSTTTAGYSLPSDFNEMRRVWIINTSSSARTSYTKLLWTDFKKLDKEQAAWDDVDRDDFALFSESQSRIVVTVAPENREKFERIFEGVSFAEIGKIVDGEFSIVGLGGDEIVRASVEDLTDKYKERFKEY